MTEKYLMTKEDVKELLGISKSTLNRWITLGEWPKPMKFGKKIGSGQALWRREDIFAFLAKKAKQEEV